MEPKILTIDDDAVIRATICATFQRHACRVVQAASGPEGLALARHENPHLILLDFALPGMSGAEVLAQLRADPALRRVPVIMLTIESQREHVQEIVRLGVSDYLVKPFTKQGLLERVQRILPLKLRAETIPAAQRFNKSLHILVVEDKPVILEQLRQSLSKPGWTVHGFSQGEEALAFSNTTVPDLILLSLSLPGDFGFTLFQLFRSHPPTHAAPIMGIVVKTAQREQARAQQLGFDGFVTKPLDLDGLPLKIARTLGLDTSLNYVQHREDCLVLTLPAQMDAERAVKLWSLLRDEISEAIDDGLQQAVIDLSHVSILEEHSTRLAVRLVDFCNEGELRFALVATEALSQQCQKLPETKDWAFAPSFEAARTLLAAPKPDPAALKNAADAPAASETPKAPAA